VIEALASGVPVATTRVGEVDRVVRDRICGRIADAHTEEKLAEAVEWCLDNLQSISGTPCTESAGKFSPAVVLEPVYENYRRLASEFAKNALGR
jgi:glycosyltransferase involved in cell wall biosynthesis